MPRQLRIGFPGAIHHLMSRGDRRENIYLDEVVRREGAAAKAERIMAQELARLGWQEEQLVRQRKNAPENLAIAARVRKETILPIKSIAVRVGLGTSKGANRNLHAWMQQTEKREIQRKAGDVG